MGNRLRILRKTRNLTQEVVSSELGISQQTLSRCEIDITTLQIDLLYKIAQYYNVSTDYILGLSDNKWTTEQNIEYSNAIVHAFQRFRAPFSGKIVHIFPEQSAVI